MTLESVTAGIEFPFFDQDTLVHRLSYALKKYPQEVVFLIGAALSAPTKPGLPGVPDALSLIELIGREFTDAPKQAGEFRRAIESAANNKKYQTAFSFLQGRLGQSVANGIVRRAVLAARLTDPAVTADLSSAPDDYFRTLEFDSQWMINPGVESMGKLITHYPHRFGRTLLTTNFDPLIEIGIRRAGGQFFKTMLQADGDLTQTEASGCHIVHLHGYWYGSDTLHTTRQLQQPRPHLRTSLALLLRNKLIAICGYSGWDDVFTDALVELMRDDSAKPEILWCFHKKDPTVDHSLAQRLAHGLSRGRISLYEGVDCNLLFPELYSAWQSLEQESPLPALIPTNPVRVSNAVRHQLKNEARSRVLEGDDQDRPPVVEVCVGRDSELTQLHESKARALFLTGIGGQGKSTLAARYFAEKQAAQSFRYFVWRDCKEESERFENQLAAVVEKLSRGAISGEDLAKQDPRSIIELLMSLIKEEDVLFVFDNVDHYVDLEDGRLTGAPELFVQALLNTNVASQVVFTCRPSVEYHHDYAFSCHLSGISLEATRALFSARRAKHTNNEIEAAHQLTDGHAFWLDLLASQIAKNDALTLTNLLERIRQGKGHLPENTLSSIWATLKEREQLVLRSMAETVRPVSELEIADFLSRRITYQKVIKAISALRALNLIVVKKLPPADDVLELHPLVREFIRYKFSKPERSSFIGEIIAAFKRYMGTHRTHLGERPTLTLLQYWSQTAELDIADGKTSDAFDTLLDAAAPFMASTYSREFSRVARSLLASIDWVSEYQKFGSFDGVFRAHITILGHLGEYAEADDLLGRYEMTVVERNVRYIIYCEMKAYSKWLQGQFNDAVKWGKIGQDLKRSSNVDTWIDPSNTLALAERDAGRPESALPIFLAGRTLAEVTDPEELDEGRGGHHYGNIGRCLHFMGQIDGALICYQKSALLLEKASHEHVMNQGYIRRWIGELLMARKQYRLAAIFLEAARIKWEQVSPPKAKDILALKGQLERESPRATVLANLNVEQICRDWILGRQMDASLNASV